jgi:hypothetical protein
MTEWLHNVKAHGPPTDVPWDKSNHTTTGPNGETISLRCWKLEPDGDPVGIAFIMMIEP